MSYCPLRKLQHSIPKIRRVSSPQIWPALILCRLVTIKGAPDILIARCSKYVSIDGDTRPFSDAIRATIEEIKNTWSSQGKRVILLARKTITKEQVVSLPNSSQFEDEVQRHARDGLTFVGIVGIVDPPRDEIPYVVSTLRGAGIRIFMVCPTANP